MKLIRPLFYLLVVISLITPAGVYANDLDDECNEFCVNNDYEDGHYLPPEPGASCNEGYEQHPENQICCCQ